MHANNVARRVSAVEHGTHGGDHRATLPMVWENRSITTPQRELVHSLPRVTLHRETVSGASVRSIPKGSQMVAGVMARSEIPPDTYEQARADPAGIADSVCDRFAVDGRSHDGFRWYLLGSTTGYRL